MVPNTLFADGSGQMVQVSEEIEFSELPDVQEVCGTILTFTYGTSLKNFHRGTIHGDTSGSVRCEKVSQRLFLRLTDVFAAFSVDDDAIAHVDEKRCTHSGAGFHSDDFSATAGSCVTLDSWRRIGDSESNFDGKFNVNRCTIVVEHGHGQSFSEIAVGIADGVSAKNKLFIGSVVHKVIVIAFSIEELCGGLGDIGLFHFVCALKCLVDYGTSCHIAQFGA